MSRIATYIIGRHDSCAFRINHSGVSRQHAEVVLLDDGRYYLTDRASTGGTFVLRDNRWLSVQQDFIHRGERIRFGDYELSSDHFEKLRVQNSGGQRLSGVAGGERALKKATDIDPEHGVMRDPVTGEVIAK